jgi:hypothetical protein
MAGLVYNSVDAVYITILSFFCNVYSFVYLYTVKDSYC